MARLGAEMSAEMTTVISVFADACKVVAPRPSAKQGAASYAAESVSPIHVGEG